MKRKTKIYRKEKSAWTAWTLGHFAFLVNKYGHQKVSKLSVQVLFNTETWTLLKEIVQVFKVSKSKMQNLDTLNH